MLFGFDDFQTTIQPLLDGKNNNQMDYIAQCIPWHGLTPMTPDPSVPRSSSTSKTKLINSSVVFQLSNNALGSMKDVLYGDISWITNSNAEKEVLFAPCLFQPLKTGINTSKEYNQTTCTHLIKVRPTPTQHVRRLIECNRSVSLILFSLPLPPLVHFRKFQK